MNDIIISNISKSFTDRKVFVEYSHTFKAGSKTCIMGASGCGKTTLLRMIAGLIVPDTGTITAKQRISYVFQEDRLIEHMTAFENCALPIKDISMVKTALCELGLKDSIDMPASKLSGGMARRVAIARAMLFDSDVVLLDEPLKGLDPATKDMTMGFINHMLKGRTFICVTHEEADAKAFECEILRLT